MNDLIPYRYVPPFENSMLVSQPEPPETAIARQNAEIAAEVLEDVSKKVLYKNLAESARDIGCAYLHCLKEVDSPVLKTSIGMDVEVEMKKNKGLERLFFGEEERGFSISIKLR